MENLMSVEDVAKVWGVSSASAKRYIKQYNLPIFMIGKHVRLKPGDVDAFLDQLRGDSSHLIWSLLNEWVRKHKDDLPDDAKTACFLVLETISK